VVERSRFYRLRARPRVKSVAGVHPEVRVLLARAGVGGRLGGDEQLGDEMHGSPPWRVRLRWELLCPPPGPGGTWQSLWRRLLTTHLAKSPRRRSARNCSVSGRRRGDRKSTRLNSSHVKISYAVFCLKKNNGRRGSDSARPGTRPSYGPTR